MRTRNVVFLVATSVFLLALSAAGGGITILPDKTGVRAIGSGIWSFFPSVDTTDGFWVTTSTGRWGHVDRNGANWDDYGSGFDSPRPMSNNKLVGYSSSGPTAWNNVFNPVVVANWPVRPWIQPAVSQDNTKVAFATGGNRIVISDGSAVLSDWVQWDPALWTMSAMAWGTDGNIYATVQDRYDAVLYGYHLFKINAITHGTTDLGKGYSQIAICGDNALTVSWNHSQLSWQKITADGLSYQQAMTYSGVNYWNLGGGNNNRFALLDGDFRLYEAAIVPEPGSIIALATGLIGLVGYRRRKR